jgi:hypothetical protein
MSFFSIDDEIKKVTEKAIPVLEEALLLVKELRVELAVWKRMREAIAAAASDADVEPHGP